jgi:hypothetical protein
MVRKRLKTALRKNLAKYLFLGIFSISLLYPFFPTSPPKNTSQPINFESSIFSSEITSSVNGFSTSLNVSSKGADVSISRDKSQIKFTTPLTNASISHSLNEVTYTVPNNNIELRYKLLENGLKEDIVLHKIPQENIFKSNLVTKNLTLKNSSNGTPVFYDLDGQYQFHIQAPYAVDGQGKVTYDLKYHLINDKDDIDKYILALEIDTDWLHDPSRILPITIDPTIVHDTISEFSGGQFNRVKDIGTGETAPELVAYYQENTSDAHTVGLWHINETSGTTVKDSSGNNNNGTATGTTIVDGILDKSRNFNGGTDNINLGNPVSLQMTGNQTIEMWLYPTDYSVRRNPYAKAYGGEGTITHETSGVLNYYYGSGGGNASPYTSFGTKYSLPLNQWSHVAIVRDITNQQLTWYVNGNITNQVGNTQTASVSSLNAYIGQGYTNNYSGKIDEVRISNIARSPEEIKMSASRRPYSVYTSPTIDYTDDVFSWDSFSWTELGVGTSEGEALYDSTSLIAHWDFNTLASSVQNVGGTCGSSCNGSTYSFNNAGNPDVPPVAVGGTLSVIDGYNIHTFRGGTHSLTLTHSIGSVEMLVVSGGGGGANTGSGGGAGGYQHRIKYDGFIYGAGSYPISVGAGGIGGTATSASGTNGGASHLREPGGGTIFQVVGGGGGVSHGGAAGQNGASGGGGPIRTAAPAAPGGGNSGSIGTSGGTGLVDVGWVGNSGGGGGAGAQGSNGGNTAGSGNGGIGLTNSITGTNTYYAGGGGGGEVNGSFVGVGGSGGGGSAVLNAAGGSGTANTGGGGAGGSYNGSYFNGGNGGSGITVIKYPNTSSGWTTDRRWGQYAMKFDGINDSIVIPDHPSTNFYQTSPFTIETWIKLNSLQDQVIINKQRNTTNEFIYALRIGTSGKATFEVSKQNVSSSTVMSNNSLETGKWYFIAATSDGTNINLYLNGILQNTTSIGFSASTQSLADIYLGQLYNDTQYLNGILDSTRIYSRTLLPHEILSNYNSGNIEFQTRVGDSSDPNDGTWDNWNPITNEAIIHSLDTAPDFSPVSYWTLNESVGTSVTDSRSTNHGRTVNATITTGKFDIGRSLAGTGYVYIPHHSSLGFTGDFTISAWVNPTTSGNRQIISKTGTGGTGGFAMLVGNMGEVFCRTDNGTTWTDSSTAWGDLPSSTGWHHVAAVRSGTQCRIYVDGIDETSTGNSHTTMAGNTLPVVIGARSDLSTEFWNGGIDEVRIYDKALSAAQVATLYNTIPTPLYYSGFTSDPNIKIEGTNSLKFQTGALNADSATIGLWHLDETSGTGAYIKDSSPKNNHGTPNGTITIGGINDQARNFNNTSDEISIGNISLIDGLSNVTIEAWIYSTTSDATHHRVFSENAVLYVGQYGTQVSFYMGDGTNWTHYSTSMGSLPTNQWAHVTWVKKGTEGYVYINGQLTGSLVSPTSLGSSTNVNYFSGYGSGQRWGGKMDEIRISNTARSANEIAESYRLGRHHYLNIPITSSDLSNKLSLPFYIAADRPGSYLSTVIGESSYANYQPDSKTIGLWSLEEQSGSGAYLLDNSGNSNHGTPTGTIFTEGKLGKARYFNGTTNTISIPNSPSLNIGNTGSQITIDFWMYPTTLIPGWQTIFYKNDGGTNCNLTNCSDRQYSMFLNSTGYLHFNSTSANNIGISQTNLNSPTGIISTNQWYHITGVIDSPNQIMRLYVNGVQVAQGSYSNSGIRTANGNLFLGATTGNGDFFQGNIDEFRISNIARTAEEIRQAYSVDTRIHQVTIDFAAKLVSSNLVVGSTDYSFNIDTIAYGLGTSASSLYLGDKIIIQENIGGTEFTTQGTVNSINSSSGAVTVSSWDAGSSFPSGGFTANATVFKWQREYFPITSSISTDRNASNLFTLRLNNGHEGRKIWIDDIRSAGSYLTNNIGSTVTSATGKRYLQYRAIFTSHDYTVSSSLTQVGIDYTMNQPPNTPVLISPTTASANQSLTPTLKTVATDYNNDALQYEIKMCTNRSMTNSCITFDQTVSNIGWSGMNVGTSAYSSGTTATYIIPVGSSLAYNTTYFWKTRAIDPLGSDTWSNTQTDAFYFSTDTTPKQPTSCIIDQTTYPGSYVFKWTDTSSDESGFEVYRVKNGSSTLLTTTAPDASSYTDNDVQASNTYAYRVRSKKTAVGGTIAYSDYCDTSQLSPNIGNTLFEGLRLEGLQLE